MMNKDEQQRVFTSRPAQRTRPVEGASSSQCTPRTIGDWTRDTQTERNEAVLLRKPQAGMRVEIKRGRRHVQPRRPVEVAYSRGGFFKLLEASVGRSEHACSGAPGAGWAVGL